MANPAGWKGNVVATLGSLLSLRFVEDGEMDATIEDVAKRLRKSGVAVLESTAARLEIAEPVRFEVRKKVLEEHYSTVPSVAFSPDGRFVATGSGDRTVKLWSVETGKEVRRLKGIPIA